jgi:DNA-binding MarR family transcriptional regulator
MPRTLKLDAFLPYRLSIASNRVSSVIATAYQSLFGLTIPQWRLVALIAEGEGLTQQALVRGSRMDKVSVSRAALGLVERGLVARAPNANDQRSHLLSLTPSGRALYEAVAPKALEMEARLFAGFSQSEIDRFAALLDRLEAAANALDPA